MHDQLFTVPLARRGDAQWIEIEPAVSWGKSSADDLFALAAQV